MLEVANSTHERNSEDVSHLDGGEGNSVATGQAIVAAQKRVAGLSRARASVNAIREARAKAVAEAAE
jgi:hypothetical protein